MANRPSVFNNEFFDAGVPAAGYKLYTYDSGTTTPKTTYTDQAGTIPNTNPITLDARGMCELWLGTGEYTLALYTGLIGSGGALVKSWDDVGGAALAGDITTLRADLASTTDATKGTNLIGFKPNYVAAVGRLLPLKLSEWISIADFGADPTGAASAVTAINAAYTHAATQAALYVATGTVTGSAAHPIVVWPYGKYLIDGTINPNGYAHTLGMRAILQVAPGVNAMVLSGYQQSIIEGLVFIGGARGIRLATTNLDSCTVHVKGCEFQQQTASVFDSDATSNSTLFSVSSTKIQNTNAGCVIGDFITLDRVVFDADCWVQAGSTTLFKLGTVGNAATGCVMDFGAFFVPYNTFATGFVVNESSTLKVDKARFGGEPVGGSTTLVQTYQTASSSTPTSLIITGSEIYSAGPTVKFYGIPNVTVIRNNTGGTVPGNGLYFDASIPAANLQALAESQSVWDVESNGCPQFAVTGNAKAMQYAWATSKENDQAETILVSDKALQIPINSGGFGASSNAVGVVGVNSTNTFGAFGYQLTAGAAFATASWNQSFTTALNGLAAGLYTAVFDVQNVTGEVLEVVTTASVTTNRFFLLKGRHVLNVPVYWDGTSSQTLGIQLVNWLANGHQAVVSSIRLFSGRVNLTTQNTVAYANAAPTTLQWEPGDRTIRLTPTVGQPKAWVCTAGGTPGTHVSEGNL